LLESDTSIISFTNDNTTNSTGNNTSSWIANNKESMITIGILVVIVVIVIVAFAIWLIMRKLKLTSLKMPIGRYASPV
jgi:predicted ABC-type sugar transport system permease subunit